MGGSGPGRPGHPVNGSSGDPGGSSGDAADAALRDGEPGGWSDVARLVESGVHARAADGLTVAVVGASGNLGTSVLRALSEDPRIGAVLGLARRPPGWCPTKTTWVRADITREPRLADLFRRVDAVVHLAWLFQPTHRPRLTWENNVLGAIRVFQAAAAASVPALVYSSSVGAYSPASPDDRDRAVDESWPTHGWPEAAYCREKAYLERYLDGFERQYPWIRVVRARPGFLFKREASREQRRLFTGPLLPDRLVRPGRLPVLPELPGLRTQVLHTDDAAEAVRAAVTSGVHGPFNLAAEPAVDTEVLAGMFDARRVRVPVGVVRAGLRAAWRTHLVPASPHLFDAVLRLPLLDCSRAHTDLGWYPRHTAIEAVEEFLRGLREPAAGLDTPPLTDSLPGGGRLREVATRVRERP